MQSAECRIVGRFAPDYIRVYLLVMIYTWSAKEACSGRWDSPNRVIPLLGNSLY